MTALFKTILSDRTFHMCQTKEIFDTINGNTSGCTRSILGLKNLLDKKLRCIEARTSVEVIATNIGLYNDIELKDVCGIHKIHSTGLSDSVLHHHLLIHTLSCSCVVQQNQTCELIVNGDELAIKKCALYRLLRLCDMDYYDVRNVLICLGVL